MTRPMNENRLLAALAATGAIPTPETVPLRRGTVLFDSDDGVDDDWIYFPLDGLVALVVTLPDGASATAAVIGAEGAVGARYLADHATAAARYVVQFGGRATRIDGAAIQHALLARPAARDILGCFVRALAGQALQTCACNAVHGLEARLARWLLHVADHCDGGMPITHQGLADMVGASRPSVSLLAQRLQAAGLIRYRRGHVQVTDRFGLEAAACACYPIVRRTYAALLQAAPAPGGRVVV